MSDPKIRVTLSEAREVAEAVASRHRSPENEMLRAIERVRGLHMHGDVRFVLDLMESYLQTVKQGKRHGG